ncbi:hypothetical protein [Amycolatopsis sp. cmx-4-61]|uniref:hypothetical protein n=1 Tax=Amycolatopsis sp. cmx-4-61 TaxID=2790937 RepID=UPI00397B1A62
MRIQTKRILQVALASGGLLAVGSGVASAESIVPGVTDAVLGQLSTNPGMHNFADTVNGVTADLKTVHPPTAADVQQPGQILSPVLPAVQQATTAGVLAPVLHAVPLQLLQQYVAPSAEADGEQPEYNLNAPVGSELAATELPALPAALPLTPAADTQQGLPTVAPVDARTISPDHVNPEAGTRVTGLQAVPQAAQLAQPVAAPVRGRGTAAPAGLPLVGGLLPSASGLLPTHAPTLNGVPDVTRLLSLGGLTELIGSTPLAQGAGGPLAQHGPASPADAATALTRG